MRSTFGAFQSSGIELSVWARGILRARFIQALGAFFVFAAVGFASAAGADTPAVRIGVADLMTPGAADTYYNQPWTAPADLVRVPAAPPEIAAQARALNNDVDLIYDYVRNNVDTVWIYGLQKGSLGALIDRSGTPFDQAKLMVDLLRAAGHSAAYRAGDITLNGTQFSAWTGITSASAACQLLSSGAIPAAVNGSTSTTCSYGAQTVTSVTMSHIWVSVTIGGQAYLFDPSYKPYSFNPGVANLSTAAGLTSGQPLTNAVAGMTSGNESSVAYVRGLNGGSLNSTLQNYATQLQSYSLSNLPGGAVFDLVGGREIVRFETPTGGLRQTALPYSASVAHSWSGEVPDQYRSRVRVVMGIGTFQIISASVFADETYGRKLVIATNFSQATPVGFPGLVVRLQLTNSAGVGVDMAVGPVMDPTPEPNSTVTLSVDHPYAAQSGAYMDMSTSRTLAVALPLTIVQGWGDAGPGLVEAWGSRLEGAVPPLPTTTECDCWTSYFSTTGEARREQMAASWLVQASLAARLNAEIGNSVFTHHHSIGVVAADSIIEMVNPDPQHPPVGTFYSVKDSFDRIDVESGISVTSVSANAIDRRAVIHASALAFDALEGSVAAQIADLPDVSSAPTRFEWGNAPPSGEDPSATGARRIYAFNAANAAQAANIVKVEGATTTASNGMHGGGEPIIGNGEMQLRRTRLANAISQYASAGFNVVAMGEAFLGPGQRGGAYTLTAWTPPPAAVYDYEHTPSQQRGGVLAATRYINGEPVEIAHINVGAYDNSKGGGGGAQAQHQSQYDPAAAADVLRSRFADRSSAVGVDLRNGGVTYSAPASINVGAGEFPYSLSAGLVWRGGNETSELFGPVAHTQPQTPWTSNWENSLSMSGSGMEAMGRTDLRAATGTIAAFIAIQDIYKAAPSTQREAAAQLAAAWWMRQMSGNVVSVSVGAGTRQFLRDAGGAWFSPGAESYATLTQTGQRGIRTERRCPVDHRITFVGTRGWDYSAMSFRVVNSGGDAQNFGFWQNTFYEPGGGAGSPCYRPRGFRMSSWTFPRGVSVNLTYQAPSSMAMEQLVSVSNSLGRSITFTYDSERRLSGFSNGLSGADQRTVTIVRDGAGKITAMTDAAGAQTRFSTTVSDQQNLLSEIFDANDTTIPSLRYTYDALERVMEARDAEALQDPATPRNPYIFRLAGVRGEREDPLGGRYGVLYDARSRPFRHIDELGRATNLFYDGRGRVTRTVYPELDEERLTYDGRNRVTQMRRVGKPGSGLADLIIAAAWNDAWNKPASIIDARGYRTDFAYVASGLGAGEIASATRPAASGAAPIGSGARPVYSFSYGSFGRLASSTDPTGLVVQNAYAAGAPFNLNSTTLNPGGLGAVTSFGYDAIGDRISAIDPRGNATSTSYDAMRRPLVVRHHNGGTGAALIAAERANYNLLGQVTSTDAGTSFAGTLVAAWATTESRTYTPTGQVRTVANGAGNVTTSAYDGLDRVLSVTDPVGRVTRNEYDAAGQLTRVMRAYGSPLQQDYARYTYSLNGQRLSVRDANNNRSEYAYDGFDRLSRLTFPSATLGANAVNAADFEQYGYDANGNRTSLRLRSGESIAFVYDNLNRETLKDIPGGTASDVYSAYDAAGRRLSARFASAGGQGVIYAYDSAGRLTSETNTIGTSRALSFQYDAASNRTRVTWPDAFFAQYTYDALNRFDLVQENATTTLANYDYDPRGRRDLLTRGNGATSDYSYDAASRLTGLAHDLPGGTADDQTFGFAYTPASQLSQRTAANDNYSWTGANITRAYTRNGLNQYTAISGTAQTHDLRGSLTNDGARTFGYDLENRLLSVAGSASATLSYDPLGRLRSYATGGVTTDFLYDGDRLVAEYNGAALTRRYVHGSGVDEPLVQYTGSGTANRAYLITDHQGSVIAENGTTTTRYSYGPYGEPNTWTGSRFRYTGQIALPEIQLYHYKARAYDPLLGRFLQTDPVGYEDDLNLYQYVGNDPLNNTDPTGRNTAAGAAIGCAVTGPACPAGAVVGAVVGTAVVVVCIIFCDDAVQALRNDEAPHVEVDETGKVHGELPDADDVRDEDIDDAIDALDESIGTREDEQERARERGQNTSEDRGERQRYRSHQDRITQEQRVRDDLERRRQREEDRRPPDDERRRPR